MKLAYIEIAGFRGAKNLLRIDVPAGFLVIAGRNGSGKSTICDAINFAITGAIREHGHKEKGETYSDYLWWRGAGAASERFVKLGFQDAQGDIQEVTRTDDGIDPSSEDILKLLYDHSGAPDRPLHALARTTLLRDEEITSLSVDLPESDRYKFVRDALGTVDLADIDNKLAGLKKQIDERLGKDQQAYGRLRDKISDLTTRLSDLRGSKSSTHDDQAVEQEIRSWLDLPDASLTELLESARKRLVLERQRLDRLHQLNEKLERVASLQGLVGAKQQLKEHLAKNTELDELIDAANKQAVSEDIVVPKEELSAERVLAEIEKVRDVIRRIENGVNWLESSSVTEMIQSLESELGELKEQSNEAYAKITRSEKATAKIKEAQKTTKSLFGEIIDEQLAELSPLIEELYKRLRPHVEWTRIKYRLRGDVRRMLSFEVGEGLNPSFVFSSGQRRAAGLAFLLAVHLSRPWCNFESLVLDDPVQHVDDFRALNLTELLTSIRKDGRQILCCVEDEALGQLMCRRLRSGTDTDGRFIRMQYNCESGVTKVDDLEIGPSRQRILVPA